MFKRALEILRWSDNVLGDKDHVIDRAIIAHPPGLLSSIWRTEKSFYECEDPVLHLDLSPLPREHDPKNESFTRDIFVASFNMLWRAPEPEPDTRSSVERIKDTDTPLLSWTSTFFYMFWPSTLTKSNNKVEFYSFTPEMMDNPAIAALIEYKWYGKLWMIAQMNFSANNCPIVHSQLFPTLPSNVGTLLAIHTGSRGFCGNASSTCWC